MNENVGIGQKTKEYKIIIDKQGHKVIEHRQVWIDNYGEIPKGFLIHHIDGNKKNNKIENLMCVSRKEHGKLHLLPNRIRIKYKFGIKVIKI